jgi:hypothetical protein
LRLDSDRTEFQRLTQWFANRATQGNSGSGDGILDWLPVLQKLHKSRNPQPRQRTTVQQFMSDHAGTLNAAFVSKYADGRNFSNTDKMNLRRDLAKTLLNNSYPHLREELDKKALAQYKADMKEWSLEFPNISSAKDISQYVVCFSGLRSLIVDIFSARDTLFDAVHPLLQAIGSYAGCYVSLIAGSAEKDDVDKGFFTA